VNAADEWVELFAEWGNDSEGNPLPLTVKTYEGAGQLGPKFAAPHDIPGLPQMPQERRVRTADGSEKVASTAVYAPKAHAGRFTLGSQVKLASGRWSTVLTVDTPDMDGMFAFVLVRLE
jgi:hypothetical protein